MALRQKRTSGYEERLQRALTEGPRPISVRQLGQEMEDTYPDLRGATYGGVRQYVKGNIQNPRVELLRAIADVLEVRRDWLAFDDGPMTEEEERKLRRVEKGLEEAPEGEGRSLQEELDSGEHETGALLPQAHTPESLLYLEDLAAKQALFGLWRALTGGAGSADEWMAAGSAVLEPLHRLDLPTTPSEPFEDYVASVAVALRQYVRAVRAAEAKDPSEEEETDGEA